MPIPKLYRQTSMFMRKNFKKGSVIFHINLIERQETTLGAVGQVSLYRESTRLFNKAKL